MKNYILPLVTFLLLMSCEEENVLPTDYSGRYSFESNDLKFTFDVTREYGVYKGENGKITHSAITGGQGQDNLVIMRYGASDDLYNEIIIRSPMAKGLYWITLTKARFTGDGIIVDEIRVAMYGQDEVVLQDQSLEKR